MLYVFPTCVGSHSQAIKEWPNSRTVNDGEIANFTCKASLSVADILYVVDRVGNQDWTSRGISQTELLIEQDYIISILTVRGYAINNGLVITCRAIVDAITNQYVDAPQPPNITTLTVQGMC